MDLMEYRAAIDEVDRSLAELIKKRMEIVAEISAYKESAGLPVYDPAREEAKLQTVGELAGDSAEEVKEVFRLLMAISRRAQYADRGESGK